MAKLYMDKATEFTNYLKEKYNAKLEDKGENYFIYGISLKKIEPAFPFDMYVPLLVDSALDMWYCIQEPKYKIPLQDKDYKNKVEELNYLFKTDHVCWEPFLREIQKTVPEILFLETYSDSKLQIIYDKKRSVTGHTYSLGYTYNFQKNELILVLSGILSSWKWSGYFTGDLTVKSFEEKIKELKEEVLQVDWLTIFEKTKTFIKNFDSNIYIERIHIPANESIHTLKEVEALPNYKVVNLPEELKQKIIDYLLENFKNELITNNLLKIINELTSKTDFEELYHTNDYGLLYEVIKTTLDIDIRDYFKSDKLSCKNYTTSSPILIPDVTNIYAYNVSNHFIIPEGNTSIPKINTTDNAAIILTLPKTINIDISPFLDSLKNIYIEYTPVKDEDGNLISPFTINKLQYEEFKDHFIIKK